MFLFAFLLFHLRLLTGYLKRGKIKTEARDACGVHAPKDILLPHLSLILDKYNQGAEEIEDYSFDIYTVEPRLPELVGKFLIRIIESSDNRNGQSWLAVTHIAYGKKTVNISFSCEKRKRVHIMCTTGLRN